LRKLRAIQILGRLCFVGFLFIFSLLIYRLWISNYLSNNASDHAREELLLSWDNSALTTLGPISTASGSTSTGSQEVALANAHKPFALIYIPRLRDDVWGIPIFEGVDDKQLALGIGHYPQSNLPSEEGNFSLFGHRTSYGQPLSNIQKLRSGDQVIVEMKDFWFVYELKFDRIVKPTALWVTKELRHPKLGLRESDPLNVITLVTCEPRYSTAKRWVWWGILQNVYLRQELPPDLAKLISQFKP
jgi:sortase A